MQLIETLVGKGAEPVRWLLIAGIAYTLATTIWSFFAVPVEVTPNETAALVPAAASQSSGNVNWILSKHLFGEAGAAPAVPVNNDAPTVTTRLPLVLQSVFVADAAEHSSAIIAEKGKNGKLYRIGEKVPGSAELIEVHSTQVVLRRAGVREALAFIKPKFALQSPEAEPQAENNRPRPRHLDENAHMRRPAVVKPQANNPSDQSSDPASLVDEYSQRLAEDAQGTLDELGIEMAEGGGYKLGNEANSSMLRQSGLQPGDTIMSVNGRMVGDVQQDRLELGNILAQGSARIEVKRGERRFFVTLKLP